MSRLAAVLLCCASFASVAAPEAGVTQAWIQADASGGWSVRAVTAEIACPSLRWGQGETVAMLTRAEPTEVAPRSGGAQADAKTSVFTLRSCELKMPANERLAQVGGFALQTPAAEVQRIVLLGDSGCRMKKSDNAFQACNDGAEWPLAEVARSAAAKQPDLVIHVGDLHYRESPCPAGNSGCAGSPWGYGDDTWRADLFLPAAPLLAAAPWIFVRGNHESCQRAGVGWVRYFAAQPWSLANSCQDPQNDVNGDFSEPYAVAISADTQLIVFDSSFAAGRAYKGDEPAFKRYQSQLASVALLAQRKPHNFFINHHPVLGFAGSASGVPKPGFAGLQSVMQSVHPARLFADGVDLVVNGHYHVFEAVSFSSGHPAELVVGNSASAMEGRIDPAAARLAQPAPGAIVETFATQDGFGFATLDRITQGWTMTEWSVGGQALKVCTIKGASLNCKDAR